MSYPSLEYYKDCVNFYKKVKKEVKGETCEFSECGGCKDCTFPDPTRFEVGFFITSNGEILSMNVEVIWYEILPGEFDEIKRSRKFLLHKYHRCEYVTFPNGNSKCCFTVNAVWEADNDVRGSAAISNSIKYPTKFVNIDISRDGENVYVQPANKPDYC
jgi:hypothetical protein